MVATLRSGRKGGQAFEILRFLVQSRKTQTMPAITEHMQKNGYKNNRFYDPSNALEDVGFANSTFVNGEKAWKATLAGKEFFHGRR